MLDIAEIRARQERRVIAALHSLNNARKDLQEAISETEAREQRFREVSEDVRRRLEALDLVEKMAGERDEEAVQAPADQTAEGLSRLLIATSPPATEKAASVVRTSSRSLFPSLRRARGSELSILT